MKTDTTSITITTAPVNASSDSTKLLSLLALAAGAVAIPQSGNADIIFTDLSLNPRSVGYTSPDALFLLTLPGTVQFGFVRTQFSTSTTFPITTTLRYRTVIAGDLGGASAASARVQTAGGLAAHLPYGAAWDQGNPLLFNASVGWANTYVRNPTSGYDREYLAFQFADSTQGGALRYGWVEVSLSIGFYPVGPNVTIWGYAYDNTGAQLTMGQRNIVPEPSATALLVFGAMAFGARGLRNWRHQRETTSQP
jgi:hypothetical protein